MAVAYRSYSYVENANQTEPISAPSGSVAGDALIMFVQTDINGSATLLSGWTLVESQSVGGAVRVDVWSCVSAGDASYTLSFANNNKHQLVLLAFSGCDQGYPVNSSSSANGGGGGGGPFPITAPSITTTRDNCLLFWSSWTQRRVLNSDPSGWTLLFRIDPGAAETPNTSYFTLDQTTAGATGDVTGTLDRAEDYIAVLLALQIPPKRAGLFFGINF